MHQDSMDSKSIYEVLENEIIPIYFEKNEKGISEKWAKMMKQNIVTNAGKYSSYRMLVDYLEKIYMPLADISEKHFSHLDKVISYIKFKNIASKLWGSIRIYENTKENISKINAGEEVEVEISVNFGDVKKENTKVEIYVVRIKEDKSVEYIKSIEMKEEAKDGENFIYKGKIQISNRRKLCIYI